MEAIFESSEGFNLHMYRFGHSECVLTSEKMQVIFQGVEYFEFYRIYQGLRITELSDKEYKHLLDYHPSLGGKKACFWKIETKNGRFVVVGMAFKVIIDEKTVLWDSYSNSLASR